MLSGGWRVERRALLNDYFTIAHEADPAARLATQQAFSAFADAVDLKLASGALNERNDELARALVARARLRAGEAALDHALHSNDPRPDAYRRAMDAIESALRTPALYVDFDDPRRLEDEDRNALANAIAKDSLNKGRLAARLEGQHLALARRMLSLQDPVGAWEYFRVLHEPVEYRDTEGNLQLALPALSDRVVELQAAAVDSYLLWQQNPESDEAARRHELAFEAFREAADRFLREVDLAAASLPAARADMDQRGPELEERRRQLEEDIAQLAAGQLSPEQVRRRLARYYSDEEALSAAMQDALAAQVTRLNERREALMRDVRRRSRAQESLENFSRTLPALVLRETGAGARTPALRIEQTLRGSEAMKKAFSPSPVPAGDDEAARLGRTAKALQAALQTHLYLAAAILEWRQGSNSRAIEQLAALSGNFVALADEMQFEPAQAPPEAAGLLPIADARIVELSLLSEAAARLAVQAMEGPTPGLRRLAAAEGRAVALLAEYVRRGSFLQAQLRESETQRLLRLLSGPRRPTEAAVDAAGQPLLAHLQQGYAAGRDATLALLRAYARLPDAAIRDAADMGIVNLLVDDARYEFEFLPSLDPAGLSAFARPGESPEAARARLLRGPAAELRREAAERLAGLKQRVSSALQPELWAALRLREGQVRELTPVEGRRGGYLGDFGGAVRDAWVPLLTSAEVRGTGVDALLANRVLPLSAFWLAYQDKLRRLLSGLPGPELDPAAAPADALPALAEVDSLLEYLGDAEAHVALMRAVLALDPGRREMPREITDFSRRMGAAHALRAFLLGREGNTAGAEKAAEDARRNYRRAATTMADWILSQQGAEADAGLWAGVGLDYMHSRDFLFALAALKRYFENRGASDRATGEARVFEVAAAMGRACEEVELYEGSDSGAVDGAIPAYLWVVRESKALLSRRKELPPPALEAFVGLARARYHHGLQSGDAAQFATAISELREHILQGTIFTDPPSGLDQSTAWRDARYWTGRCALELARLERQKDPPAREALDAHLALAVTSFDDLVQRFHEERSPLVREALLRLARAEWMQGVYASGDAGTASLKRAAARLGGLLDELDGLGAAERGELLPEAVALRGDVLELLGRRLHERAARDPAADPTEARRYLQDSVACYERLDRDYPQSRRNAWGLSQRIACLRLLGASSQADAAAARRLLAGAATALERVSDAEWQQAEPGMDKAYWSGYFAWLGRQGEGQNP